MRVVEIRSILSFISPRLYLWSLKKAVSRQLYSLFAWKTTQHIAQQKHSWCWNRNIHGQQPKDDLLLAQPPHHGSTLHISWNLKSCMSCKTVAYASQVVIPSPAIVGCRPPWPLVWDSHAEYSMWHSSSYWPRESLSSGLVGFLCHPWHSSQS